MVNARQVRRPRVEPRARLGREHAAASSLTRATDHRLPVSVPTVARMHYNSRMRFRPCIDLHQGRVKQIVGSTFCDDDPDRIATNFASTQPASWFAALYRRDRLPGGHVIMLGPGNEAAAEDALRAYPGGFHVGGGITEENAPAWLERGAAAVIVTSHVFRDGRIDEERLARLVARVGRARLVLDLSCRKRDGRYWVVTDRWQKFTAVEVDPPASTGSPAPAPSS